MICNWQLLQSLTSWFILINIVIQAWWFAFHSHTKCDWKCKSAISTTQFVLFQPASNILVQYQPETISNTTCLFINIYLKQCTLQAIYTLADPSSLEICCQIVRKMPVLKYISHIFNSGNVNHSAASFSSICLRASSRAQVPNLKKKQLTLAFPLVFPGKLQGIFLQIIP